MKTLRLSILALFCCLAGTCGSFNASYTDPNSGATYHGGVTVPKSTVADNK